METNANKSLAIADDIAANPFAWPGGYERWAITDDGGELCYRCCKTERSRIADSFKGDGWHVVGTLATCEVDDWSTCDHCGADLPGTADKGE